MCSDGYSKTVAFTCTECVKTGGSVAIMVVAAVFVLFGGVALYMHLMSGEMDGARRGIVAWLTKRLPLQSIKILVVVWQIVTQASDDRIPIVDPTLASRIDIKRASFRHGF